MIDPTQRAQAEAWRDDDPDPVTAAEIDAGDVADARRRATARADDVLAALDILLGVNRRG